MDALPDFAALARAYGHVGFRVENPNDVEPVLREAMALKGGTIFMDFVTDPVENVWPGARQLGSPLGHRSCRATRPDIVVDDIHWPMVPAGAGLADMLLQSADLSR